MTAAAMAVAVLAQLEPFDEGPSENKGNMVKTLAFFAAWRSCNSCGTRVLYVDENLRTDTPFVCGHCEKRAQTELANAARIAGAGSLGTNKPN
jgi:hypothetical protein